jgi:hypothetical protein
LSQCHIFSLSSPKLKIEKNQISKKYKCWRVPHFYKYECTAAFLSNVKYSLTFPPFFFTFVAKFIFLLSDIMATTDLLLKQSTTNNRHVHTQNSPKVNNSMKQHYWCDGFSLTLPSYTHVYLVIHILEAHRSLYSSPGYNNNISQ